MYSSKFTKTAGSNFCAVFNDLKISSLPQTPTFAPLFSTQKLRH